MNFRDKKGSITIFVLVGLLFMSAFLVVSFAGNINKSKIAKEQFQIVSKIYSYAEGEEGAYDKAYTDLRKKNKQTISSSTVETEETGTLELLKAFDENMSNYRIYGNSVQNGTPDPTAPVEVESVGNKTKNLIGFEDFSASSKTVSRTCENGIFTSTNIYNGKLSLAGLLSADNFTAYSKNNRLEAGTYILSIYAFEDSLKPNKPYLEVTYDDGTIEKIYTDAPTTLTQDATISLLKQSAVAMEKGQYFKFKMQLEKGNIGTEYEEYGKYKIPVKVSGKNLISKDILKTKEWHNFAGGKNSYYIHKLDTEEGKSYTLSFDYTTLPTYIYIQRCPKGEEYTNDNEKFVEYLTTNQPVRKQYTFNDNGDYDYYIWFYSTNLEKELGYIKYIQLEEGIVATNYEPGAQIVNILLDEPLRKVGDYADYIDFKEGKVVRQIYKASLDKSTNKMWYSWGVNYMQEGYTGFFAYFSHHNLPVCGQNTIALCNILPNRNIYGSNKLGCQIIKKDGYFILSLRNSDLEDISSKDNAVNSLKKLLVNMKVDFHYVVETPTEEEIDLEQLKTYEDYTKIEVLTEIEPSKIEVEYQGYTLE